MKRSILSIGLGFVFLVTTTGCDSSRPRSQAGKQERVAGANTALLAPPGAAGWMGNDEGVSAYRRGHWDLAEGHFRKAIKADPRLAEAHFNLALTLDKLGKHEDATASFQRAVQLAPDNPTITDSPILMAHTGS